MRERSKMQWLAALVLALVLAPGLAAAQQKTPDDWYKEGETQYNLGNFDKAIEAFKQGFSLETVDSKKSAYLYNIAQSYRQAKDCSNAQFFYKRFLALRDADPSKPLKQETRKEVMDRIKELEECARNQEAIKNRPPDKNLKPDDPEGGPTQPKPNPDTNPRPPKPDDIAVKPNPDDGEDDDGEDTSITTTAVATQPRLISARLIGGGAKIKTGKLEVPIQATGAVIAGYPISVGNVTVEVGAGFTFTPVPYDDQMARSKSALLMGLLGNVGATYLVMPKLGVRGDLGLGALFFSGVSESPFTANRAIEGGALSMFHVRVGVSADYAITPNVVATVTPVAFSYSPAKAGLEESIKSITAIDFMVGLGYRM